MRVLIVSRYMGIYGGAETLVREFAVRLKQLGINVCVVTLNISDEVRRLCQDVSVIVPARQFPYEFRSTSVLSSLGVFGEIHALRRLVKDNFFGYDIINVHNFPANWVCGGLNKPVVWMCNEVPDFYNNPRPSLAINMLRACGIAMDRLLVNRNVNAICVADDLNAAAVRRRYGRDSVIIPYGIDIDVFFKFVPDISQVGLKPGVDINLLQVGVISPEKNQMESVRALQSLRDAGHKPRLVLVGSSSTLYADALRRYIKQQGLESFVEFAGQVTKAAVAQYYRSADICLFPVKTQGGWLAPFEALSCAKPVIVSDTMGAAVLIKQFGFGMVSGDFARDIPAFVHQRNIWELRANEASIWIRQNLTWQAFTDKMLNLFERSLAASRDFYAV